MKVKKFLGTLLMIFLLAFSTFLILHYSIPKASPRLEIITERNTSNNKDFIHYVALGDSLTEGIGDEMNQGGFVPLISSTLQETFSLNSIEVENYGVAGNRSDQILKRLQEEEDVRKNISASDIITLTVGGNDLMKVIKKNIFGLSVDSFSKPLKKYQDNLSEILTEIQMLNPDAPIYVVGIYNPFYVNFPEITDMQIVVENWNEGTEDIVNEVDNSYFVPVDEVISSGLGQSTSTTSSESSEDNTNDLNIVKNNVLYEKDSFHPNNLGYQLMAKEISTEIIRTEDCWLPKEDE